MCPNLVSSDPDALLLNRHDDEVGRIARVRPPPRRTCWHGLHLSTLPGMNRGRGSWNLLAECVVGYRNEDPIVRRVARRPDRVRTHHQVVNTESDRAEQRPLVDARLTIRIAGVCGGPSSRYAGALRIDEFEDHAQEIGG